MRHRPPRPYHARPHQASIAAPEDHARTGAIPSPLPARRAERPVGLTHAQRAAGGPVPAAKLEPTRLAAEFATPCHDDLVRTCDGPDELLRTRSRLGLHDGHVTATRVADEDKRTLRERRAERIDVIPTLDPGDIRDLRTVLARLDAHGYTTPHECPWLAGVELALDRSAPLWCDDAAMRGTDLNDRPPTMGTPVGEPRASLPAHVLAALPTGVTAEPRARPPRRPRVARTGVRAGRPQRGPAHSSVRGPPARP